MTPAKSTASLKEQLAPIATKLREGRALIRPISQVLVRLKPLNAQDRFVATIDHILRWINNRAGRKLPETAWQGKSFELSEIGSQRTAAVALAEPRFWAARLDDADKNVPMRTWVTEIGIGADGGDVLFGARLICTTRGEDAPFDHSIPGFVRPILQTGPAWLDDHAVGLVARFVDDESGVDDLVHLLEDRGRRAPVVVFSLPERDSDPSHTAASAANVHRLTLGAAHVFIISGRAAFWLSDLIGKEFSVYRQAVRIYKPGLEHWRDDPYRHPVVMGERIAAWPDGGPATFERWLTSQALAITAHNADRDELLPRFDTVRQIAAQLERRAAKAAGSTDNELLALVEEDNKALEQTLREQRETYEGLLLTAEKERDSAVAGEREAQARTFALRERIRVLEARASDHGDTQAVPIPPSLEGFEEWCQTYLAGSVEVHSRALQGVKKSVFRDPTLLYRALLLLREHYVPMKRLGGKELVAGFDKACRSLDIENSHVGEAVKRHKEEYTIQWGGQPRPLDWHLKSGDARERTKCFRLYYFWDDESQCVVVGSMPAHLKSDLT